MKKIILSVLVLLSAQSSFATSLLDTQCGVYIIFAKTYLEADGTAEDEDSYLRIAQAALNTCSEEKGQSKLGLYLDAACEKSSNQKSDLYRGNCTLKAAEFVQDL